MFDVAQKVIWFRQERVDVAWKSISYQQKKIDAAQKCIPCRQKRDMLHQKIILRAKKFFFSGTARYRIQFIVLVLS